MGYLKYKGKELNSKLLDGKLEPDKIKFIRDNIYKVSHEEALDQIEKVLFNNRVIISKIYYYYFARVAHKVVVKGSKWSVYDVLHNDKLIQAFINRTYTNDKVFKNGLLTNFKKAIDMGGRGNCKKSNKLPFKRV